MAHRIAPRVLVCISAAAIVAFTAFYCRQVRQDEITLGALAGKSANHTTREVRVTNAGPSNRVGQFIVFTTDVPTRYPVVFRIASIKSIPVNCTTFTGTCRGVQDVILVGCPCDPPFVLIDNVKPDVFEQ